LQLNGFEVRKGKSIAILPSLNNHRLFVGNIPKNRDREELFEEFTKHARKSDNKVSDEPACLSLPACLLSQTSSRNKSEPTCWFSHLTRSS
jgi:RNA recognition motif-containing protein